MAGPWFAVLEDGGAWQRVDSIWIADGDREEKVEVQVRARLTDHDDDNDEQQRRLDE